MITAQKGTTKIAIEIKSFTDESTISAFHEAMGQYDNYAIALEDEEPDRKLFLAIPSVIYGVHFNLVYLERSRVLADFTPRPKGGRVRQIYLRRSLLRARGPL